ncbi:unnamed protein product [Closterium sp. NIES-64]|nr:unnamed protein product [Closterium sp. NIES-64]
MNRSELLRELQRREEEAAREQLLLLRRMREAERERTREAEVDRGRGRGTWGNAEEGRRSRSCSKDGSSSWRKSGRRRGNRRSRCITTSVAYARGNRRLLGDALPWVLLAGGAVAAAAVVHHKRRCHRSRQQHAAAESVVGSSGPPLGACSAPLFSPHGPPFSPHAPTPRTPRTSAFPRPPSPWLSAKARPAVAPRVRALLSSASSARSLASCPGASPVISTAPPSSCNHGARSCTSGPRVRGAQGIGAPVAEASPQKELSGALSGVGPRIEGEGGRGERGDGGIWAEGGAEKGKGNGGS